ncbi:MAG: SDR family oxidoreductase [Polyangiaceae bacterium]
MARPGYESVVLVTGFPSFLARRLVLHLVHEEPKTLVMAVVLPRLMVEARRVIDALDLQERERVVLLEGDAAAIDLGLSGSELRQLARDVDRIHHVAHASYVGVDKATAHALNVVGAGEIAEVARLMTGLSCLVFHSTAFVSGDTKGTVFEEDLPEHATYRGIIEETRARAERAIRRASKQLPIAVVRPSMVVGASGTGEVDRLDLPYLFVLLLLAAPADLQLPIGARANVPFHVVPSDFVVRAACAIGRDPRAPGRTFHLVDPNPVPVRRFVEIVHAIRARRESWVELSTLARSVLLTPGIEGYLKNPKALVDQILTSVRYDSRNADLLLTPLGIRCPPVEEYAERIVATVEERLVNRTAFTPPRSPEPSPAAEGTEGDAPSHDTDAMD